MKPFVFSFLLISSITIIFNDYQNSTFFSKTFIFSLFSIGFIIYFLLKTVKRKQPIFVSNVDFSFFILFGFIILNHFLHQNSTFSLRFYDLLSLFSFYVLARTFFDTKKQIFYSILGVITGIFINSLYGLGQFLGYFSSFHSEFSITGSFFNPAPFSGLLAIGNVLLLFSFLYRKLFYRYFSEITHKKITAKIFLYGSIFAFLLNTFLLITLKSRASWLSFLVGSLFLILYKIKPKIISTTKKQILIVSTCFLVVLSGFFFYSLRKNSADGRMLVWKISSEIIKKHPLTGVGLDKFKAHYMNYQANYFSENKNPQEVLLSDNIVYAFNDFIQFVVEQGFIGLFLLIFLLFSVMKKPKNNRKIIGFSLLISLFVFACFSYPLQILPLKVLGIFGFAIISFSSERKWRIFPSNIFRFAVISVICGFLIFQTNTIYQLHTGYKLWKNAMDSYFSNEFSESIFYFEKAYPLLKTEGEFLMHYGKALGLNENPKKSNEILRQAENYLNNSIIQTSLGDNYRVLKDYKNAEKHYQKASDMIPNQLYPVFLLAKMYEEKGDLKNAKEQAQKLLQMPVKVASMAVFEMQEEMKNILDTKYTNLQ